MKYYVIGVEYGSRPGFVYYVYEMDPCKSTTNVQKAMIFNDEATFTDFVTLYSATDRTIMQLSLKMPDVNGMCTI